MHTKLWELMFCLHTAEKKEKKDKDKDKEGKEKKEKKDKDKEKEPKEKKEKKEKVGRAVAVAWVFTAMVSSQQAIICWVSFACCAALRTRIRIQRRRRRRRTRQAPAQQPLLLPAGLFPVVPHLKLQLHLL
jgi:Flp pilus assembly protein TadB